MSDVIRMPCDVCGVEFEAPSELTWEHIRENPELGRCYGCNVRAEGPDA